MSDSVQRARELLAGITPFQELADEVERLRAELRSALNCCGVCPPILGGGIDCTCADNPRCPNSTEADS